MDSENETDPQQSAAVSEVDVDALVRPGCPCCGRPLNDYFTRLDKSVVPHVRKRYCYPCWNGGRGTLRFEPTLRDAAIEEADQLRKLASRSDVFHRAALELEAAAHLFPPNVEVMGGESARERKE